MAESDFNDLLHAAEQLAAEVEGSAELPKVDRTLRQVLEASTELWSRVTQAGAQDIQAHLLLGSKGVDLPQLSQKLETLSTRKTFEPLEPAAETDIPTFLKNEVENAILSVIEESNRNCFADSEARMWEDEERRWRQEKQRFLNSLVGTSDEIMAVSKTEYSVLNESVLPGVRSQLSNQEMGYAKVVQDYNKVIVQGGVRPSLVDMFQNLAVTFNEKKVQELWEMVQYMVKIPAVTRGDEIASRYTHLVQEALVRQARKYLEDRYKTYITCLIEGNMQQAKRGGIPGTYALVISFVKLRVKETSDLIDGFVEGVPVWPLVYYCLRCGDVSAALQVTRKANLEEISSVFEEILKNPGTRLSAKSDTYLKFEYKRSVRMGTDLFKKLVYCSLATCDPTEEHERILTTADDYLWMKLCLVRHETVDEARCGERLTLQHLQSLILEEYGEKYYNAQEQPLLYFELLFLSGQFEAAVEFLARTEKFKLHAVHIAIALHELNIIGLPTKISEPILSVEETDMSPARRLNLARLILLYVRKFEYSDPMDALQYYYFLRNMKNEHGQNLFIACINDMVLESRSFDLVLGNLDERGCRIPGLIDNFEGVQADLKEIIETVGDTAEKKGLLEDAISLYDLSGNHNKVLQLMTTLLSQVVHQVNKPGSLRTRLQALTENIYCRYLGQELICSQHYLAAFCLLRDVMSFFDQYHAQQYNEALESIERTKLIPLRMEEVDDRVNNFKRLNPEVCKNMPDILLTTMNILYTLYNKAKASDTRLSISRLEDGGKEKQLSFYRERARALTTFAGTVPYQMPGDTNSRLVQLEVLMH